MGRLRHHFSKQEIATLVEMKAAKVSNAVISVRMGRSECSIAGKCLDLAQRGLIKRSGPERRGRQWTEAEKAENIRRGDLGHDFSDIARDLGRTRYGCVQQYDIAKRAKSKPPPDPRPLCERMREARDHATELRRQPPEHATITAQFFGDPLPGRSALDQRKQPCGPGTSTNGAPR
jgi:hypothetical protein